MFSKCVQLVGFSRHNLRVILFVIYFYSLDARCEITDELNNKFHPRQTVSSGGPGGWLE